MKKHTSHVRLFVALAALGMAGLTTACSQSNPASPSSLSEIAPTEEVPLSELEDLRVSAGGTASRKVR